MEQTHLSQSRGEPPVRRSVLVTGGAGGIGASISHAFARNGWRVAVHEGFDHDRAAAIADKITQAGGTANAFQADLSEARGAAALFGRVSDEVGPIHALINNAAADPGAVPLSEVDEVLVDRLLATNVRAPLMLTRAAASEWVQTGYPGTVVNVSSIQSAYSIAGHSVYAASKGAIDAMTRQLAVELGPYGIRVNGVAPGFIEVPRTICGRPDYDRDRSGNRIPLGRVGFPNDVSGVVTFLCSDAARYVNGHIITIDGGSVCQLPGVDHRRPLQRPAHA